MFICENKIVEIFTLMVNNKFTIRKVSSLFMIPKSTIYYWYKRYLLVIDPHLYYEVKSLLSYNKSQRALRGGLATRSKYLNKKRLEV